MKEHEIRPKRLFDQYLSLAEKDISTFFSNCAYSSVRCPACAGKGKFEFEKKGFKYELCQKCGTLFASPRPDEKAFMRFYEDSPSADFWATDFYRSTETARREKIHAPRVVQVKRKVEKYMKGANGIVDIGAGYGTFLEEYKKTSGPHFKAVAIEPSASLSKICSNKRINVINKFTEALELKDIAGQIKGFKVFTCFELLEHVHTPINFLTSINRIMSHGDILIMTSLSATGFDIQLLWENSKSVSPPHHINFLNPTSIEILIRRAGLQPVEVTTPGKLDVDIVMNNFEYVKDRFFLNFLKNSNEKNREGLQEFLQRNNLSSHMMAVAIKK